MPTFQYGNTAIEYTLIYDQDRQDISITVEWIDGVTVFAPKNTSLDKLSPVLHNKAPWILQKWKETQEVCTPPQPKEYVSGEKFHYLGRSYRLKVGKSESSSSCHLRFHKGRFLADVPISMDNSTKKDVLYTLFKQWYLDHGQAKVNRRLTIYTSKMNLSPKKLQLKEQKNRWGSCTAEGNIYLNWRIILAPMNVIDYVIVHELAHLKHPNHSNDFWRLVRSILPDYEHRKEWLRINGPNLNID